MSKVVLDGFNLYISRYFINKGYKRQNMQIIDAQIIY